MTTQQPAPASAGTQVVSWLPAARKTDQRAEAAPAQTGNSRMAMIILHHFGTPELFWRGGSYASQNAERGTKLRPTWIEGDRE